MLRLQLEALKKKRVFAEEVKEEDIGESKQEEESTGEMDFKSEVAEIKKEVKEDPGVDKEKKKKKKKKESKESKKESVSILDCPSHNNPLHFTQTASLNIK